MGARRRRARSEPKTGTLLRKHHVSGRLDLDSVSGVRRHGNISPKSLTTPAMTASSARATGAPTWSNVNYRALSVTLADM